MKWNIFKLPLGGFRTVASYWAISALLIALFIVVFADESPVESNADTYCEMVSIFKESDGKHGWPDYNESYNEVCPEGR